MNIITPLNVFYIPHWADSSKYVYVQHVAYTVPLVLYVSLILTQNQHTKPLAYSCHKIQLQGSQNIALDIWPTMLSSRVQRKGTGKHSTDLYLRVGLVAVFRNCSSELKKGGGEKNNHTSSSPSLLQCYLTFQNNFLCLCNTSSNC